MIKSKIKQFILYRYLLFVLVCIAPYLLQAQQVNHKSEDYKKELMTVDGKLVCITEEMAKFRNIKPSCAEYGHIVGMQASDGTIWSFFPNPLQKELDDNSLVGKKIKITGRLFYDGKFIEIVEYQFMESKESKKS